MPSNEKISQLDDAPTLTDADLFVVARAGIANYKLSVAALRAILVGYASPAFGSFGITGQSGSLEVGAAIASGTKTFTWTTTNGGNVAANSISIADTTTSTVLGSSLANDGTEALSIAGVTNNVPATHVWTVAGTDTQSGNFSRTFTVSWLWRGYAGTSTSPTLDATAIKALSDYAALTGTALRTYSLTAGGYKYVCFPDSFATPTAWLGGAFSVPLATSGDDAAYSHPDTAGNAYALVSVTNANGQATNYRVYRSQNVLGGTLNLTVS